MTITGRWPQAGDPCVDLKSAATKRDADRVGEPMTVKTITQTLIITNTGAKYHRSTLTPINEGVHSARHLVSPSDPRVLCVRGQQLLADLSRMVDNLTKVDRVDPMDYVGAFATVISEAARARTEFISLSAAASRAEQESDR